jgi:hypothetical protein
MWNLTSFRLETVLVLVQDSCTICAKRTIDSELILDGPNGTPRWRGSSEISVCLEIVLILAQDRWTVCVERTIGLEIFWTHLMELVGGMGHVESLFFPFGDSVSVVQDRCMVCARCTIGLKVVLDAPDATTSLRGSTENSARLAIALILAPR